MIYWFLIIFGIFTLSISLSNQVYNLVIKKYITVNLLFQILIRITLFFVAIMLILGGLYIESNY
jgi:hypothetical protein